MVNKCGNVQFTTDCVVSDVEADSHALAGEKAAEPKMARSMASIDVNSVNIGDLNDSPETEYMSTSTILHFCKSKILFPYLKILTIMGLRPVIDVSNSSKCAIYFSHYHSAQVAVLMFLGYILQYMACFRRDRGFCYQMVRSTEPLLEEYDNFTRVCYGNLAFAYIGPSLLHFFGFIYSLYLFRISDNEQLQNLMERVFLLSSYAQQGMPTANPKRLLRVLWCYIIISGVWMGMSLCSVNLTMAGGTIDFRWMEWRSPELKLVLKILLALCTLVHDMVQATVITSYCLQAQLLQAHLVFLKERLLNRTITPLNWMREISEFRKLLRYLNDELAPAVCLFTIVNASWAVSGLAWLLQLDGRQTPAAAAAPDLQPVLAISILNEFLWISAALAPFVQAARLSSEGRRIQSVGHELCVRPFLHQDTSQEDIATVLMFASTLKLDAKLFHYPIVGTYLFLILTVTTIVLFSLGMCHFI